MKENIYCGIVMVFLASSPLLNLLFKSRRENILLRRKVKNLLMGLRRVLPGIFISRMTVMQSSKFPHGMHLSLAMENILYPEMVTN